MIESLTFYTATLRESLEHLPYAAIEQMIRRLHTARMAGQQVFVVGNGGSATTASHFACDLGKNTVSPHAPRFRALSLTDNMGVFSAIANDLGYENVFAEQLANLVDPNDVVIAISASGNSPNVLQAVELAKRCGAFTVGWSGYQGGKLANLAELPIVIRNDCIEQIEDLHLVLAHMVTMAVRKLGIQVSVTPPEEEEVLLNAVAVVNGNGHD